MPLSMVVHLPGYHTTSSLKGYLSFTSDRSRFQRLRACVFFPIALPVPPSLARDPSCLASLPSNSKLLALLSQHRSSQVMMCSSGWRLKSFCISGSSRRGRDWVMISGSASSSFSHDGPGSVIPYGVNRFFCAFLLLYRGD